MSLTLIGFHCSTKTVKQMNSNGSNELIDWEKRRDQIVCGGRGMLEIKKYKLTDASWKKKRGERK